MNWVVAFTCAISISAERPIDFEVVTIHAAEAAMNAGQEAVITISVTVRPGYHIQAADVVDALLVPAQLMIGGGNEFQMLKAEFPPAQKFALEGTDESLDVYDGEFEIHVRLLALADTAQKEYILNATFRYQACDSMRCLFPRMIKFPVHIRVL